MPMFRDEWFPHLILIHEKYQEDCVGKFKNDGHGKRENYGHGHPPIDRSQPNLWQKPVNLVETISQYGAAERTETCMYLWRSHPRKVFFLKPKTPRAIFIIYVGET